MKAINRVIFMLLSVSILAGWVILQQGNLSLWDELEQKVQSQRTVADAIALYGPLARARLRLAFVKADVTYPPARLAFLAFKAERRLELWAWLESTGWRWVKNYPIRANSGGPGPKLREGDRQIPEGIYEIIGLNPNSQFHLSMKLNYPNAFDLKHAQREGRTQPGSDIFIHGKAQSVGCLAMGDSAIEELFVLVETVGMVNVEVIIAPHDFRQPAVVLTSSSPSWVSELYAAIRLALQRFSQ